jgi:hypothetical protein
LEIGASAFRRLPPPRADPARFHLPFRIPAYAKAPAWQAAFYFLLPTSYFVIPNFSVRPYRFFFPLPGITLATALAIEPATFATTPFLEARFLAFGFDFDVDFDLDFVFFFAAVFAIPDSPTPLSFR